MLLQLHRDLYKFLGNRYGGKYISLEKIIENSKESSYGWHNNENDYEPFVKYTLGMIVSAYRDFESRVILASKVNISKFDRIAEIMS